MLNIKLFSKLQASDTVNLVLMTRKDGMLDYYLISIGVAYSVLSTGVCEGEIEGPISYFNVRMSSLAPLLDKGMKFRIQYREHRLYFISDDENIQVSLLYVESKDESMVSVVEKYLDVVKELSSQSRRKEQLQQAEQALISYRHALEEAQSSLDSEEDSEGVSLMNLSGWVNSSNPFDSPGQDAAEVLEKRQQRVQGLQDKIKQLEDRVLNLQSDTSTLTCLDMCSFSKIVQAAGRAHEMIDFCKDYAVLQLKTSFVIQKGPCPVMSMQGTLLSLLLRDGKGEGFYMYKGAMVYMAPGEENTVVFSSKYLPNTKVSDSIITRGVAEEKYSINLKGLLSVMNVVHGRFPEVRIDTGSANFILANEQGEEITIKFTVENADTLQLRKMMRTGDFATQVKMASIKIPREVQSLLSLFTDQLVIYVKRTKIILQSDSFYVVFGREG